MLTQGPQIMLSFAVDEPDACGSLQYQQHAQLTEAQRLKAIESYALIAASYAVSVQKAMSDCDYNRNGHNATDPVHSRNTAPFTLNRLSQYDKAENTKQQNQNNHSSLGLSLRLQDTFRNYLRMRVPNQINHIQQAERHRPSRELRQMFTDHLVER